MWISRLCVEKRVASGGGVVEKFFITCGCFHYFLCGRFLHTAFIGGYTGGNNM